MQRVIDHQPGMRLGIGFDQLTGAVRGLGVRSDAEASEVYGQEIKFSLDLVQSREQLASALSVGAKANFSYGLFSASAKMNLVENSEMTSYSAGLLVRMEVKNSWRIMEDEELVPSALELAQRGAAPRFRERFGDYYVQGVLTGGELLIAIQLREMSAKESQELFVSAKASYGAMFSGEGEVTASARHELQQSSREVKVLRVGGDIAEPMSINIDEAIEQMRTFHRTVVDEGARPYQALLQDYLSLDLGGADFDPISIRHADDMIRLAWTLRQRRLSLLTDIARITTNPDDFVWDVPAGEPTPTPLAELAALQPQLLAEVDEITQRAKQCADDPSACQGIELPSTAYDVVLPRLSPDADGGDDGGTIPGGGGGGVGTIPIDPRLVVKVPSDLNKVLRDINRPGIPHR